MPEAATSFAWDYPAPYILTLTTQADDIDGLHHANNAVYVHWCEKAAWAHSEFLGLSLGDYERLDRAMAIRRGEYDYLLPARLGDKLELATWLTSGDGRLSLVRQFQLRRVRDGATLLRAKWDLVCIELSSGKVKRMPAEFGNIYNAAVIKSQA